MTEVYASYPDEYDYRNLLGTMLVVLRDAQEVSNRKTLAKDPERASAQKFSANCIMVMRNIMTSLNELYFDKGIPTRVTLAHLPDKGWTIEFNEIDTRY